MRWAVVETPIGAVRLGAAGGAVRAVRLPPATGRSSGGGDPAGTGTGLAGGAGPGYGIYGGYGEPVLDAAVRQLREYFAGVRTGFDLSTALASEQGSDFERAVWAELARIPYGEQRTYGAVATAVGDPGAAQAVGTACNRNPLPLVVPCHRVVGSGGKLVGFGGGLAAKRWLLEHEARFLMERSWQ